MCKEDTTCVPEAISENGLADFPEMSMIGKKEVAIVHLAVQCVPADDLSDDNENDKIGDPEPHNSTKNKPQHDVLRKRATVSNP